MVKLVFSTVYRGIFFLYVALKHIGLWILVRIGLIKAVLTCTNNLCYAVLLCTNNLSSEQEIRENIKYFQLK